MLSKISSLFTGKSHSEAVNPEMPAGHPGVKGGDAGECPFMQKNKGKNQKEGEKCPVTGQNANPGQTDTDSDDEEKPRGGCPFMGTSQKKKNPGLCVK